MIHRQSNELEVSVSVATYYNTLYLLFYIADMLVGWFVALRTYDNGNRAYWCRYSTNRNGNTTMGIGHITAVIVLTGNTTIGIGH